MNSTVFWLLGIVPVALQTVGSHMCWDAGERTRAVASYQRSLAIDPKKRPREADDRAAAVICHRASRDR